MANSGVTCRRVLITGPPGVGKTTLVRRVRDELLRSGLGAIGFYTEEVRDAVSRERIGFDVVSIAENRRAIMARVSGTAATVGQRLPTVGKYSVDTATFESLALSTLAAADRSPVGKTVLIIDEIGKMELFSRRFVTSVRQLFGLTSSSGGEQSGGTLHTLLATVPVSRAGGGGIALVEELKSLPDVQLVTISKENREQMAAAVAKQLKAALGVAV